MLDNLNEIEGLKHSFNVKPELGEKLPNPKDVADKSSYYLKSGDTFIKHKMINGKWMREVVNNVSQVIFEPVE